jgi:hypothetical protein
MRINWRSLRSGLAWIVFSPLAFLMAAMADATSDIAYDIQLVICGTWSVCGIVSGIGRIAGASWAVRLQSILCWVAFAAFAVPGVALLGYSIKNSAGLDGLALAVGVFSTGMPFLIYARRLQRELRERRLTSTVFQ